MRTLVGEGGRRQVGVVAGTLHWVGMGSGDRIGKYRLDGWGSSQQLDQAWALFDDGGAPTPVPQIRASARTGLRIDIRIS
ncbi:hypothetical protein [uncultured Thiodictyon sp.]|uniref:hypothetical protein n=1 Tax=uncultured Thiodictyon sp. TaxID=1846217 RepID=UPI0025DAD6C1|nr:hypothetical protein [uncultured Thiodictyon sp.]